MKVTWTLIPLLLFLGSSVLCVEECDSSQAEHCYDTLVHYEGLGFPLYGKDEEELNETCEMMAASFECIQAYSQHCNESEACDGEDCAQMLADIDTFATNTGLRKVEKELCHPGATRQAYLDNYSCLESNIDHYAACHNDSQMSQDYMMTMKTSGEAIVARCCFFTWYHDCFTNITRKTCNDDATFLVSFMLHNLIGHISDQMCGKSPDVCDRPPLPHTHSEEDGHKVITEVDNTLDGAHKSDATRPFSSLWTSCIMFVYILFSLYFI